MSWELTIHAFSSMNVTGDQSKDGWHDGGKILMGRSLGGRNRQWATTTIPKKQIQVLHLFYKGSKRVCTCPSAHTSIQYSWDLKADLLEFRMYPIQSGICPVHRYNNLVNRETWTKNNHWSLVFCVFLPKIQTSILTVFHSIKSPLIF